MPITIPVVAADGAKSTVTVADPVVSGSGQTVKIGETNVLTGGIDTVSGNTIIAQPITLTQQATVLTLSLYVSVLGGNIRMGLYSGATLPTTKVAECAEFTPVVGWNTKLTLTTPLLAPGKYWLVYLPQTNSLGFPMSTTGATSYYKGLTYGPLPTTFPTGLNSTALHWSFYGTFLQGPLAIPATPTNLTGIGFSSSEIDLTWTASVGATGYHVYRNGVIVGNPATTSYADLGLTASTSYTYTVSAFNSAGASGQTMGVILVTRAVSTGGGLPNGVTLQAIDGETMTSSTTMSHNYFNGLGATLATSPPAGFKSWDDPTFFPHTSFYGLYIETGMADFLDVGLNCSIDVTLNNGNQPDIAALLSNHVWATSECKGRSAGTAEENPLNNAFCGLTVDEDDPSNYIGLWGALETNRFWVITGTWNCFVFNGPNNQHMDQLLSRGYFTGGKSIGIWQIDIYWFSGSAIDGTAPPGGNIQAQGGQSANGFGSASFTVDQMCRGSNYGNMIDQMRAWGNGTNTGGGGVPYGYLAAGKSGATSAIPFFSLIETGNGHFDESTKRDILAKEWNWAVWSSIIHGARGIDSFSSIGEFTTGVRTGDTVSMHDQGKATVALINSLASVITSPFAKGYLTAVTPHGYIFPVYESDWMNGGVEACVKWDSTNFYIIATTRESESTTNLSATFTLNSNVSSSQVTVIGESRTIAIIGHQFTDTFANAWTVHIYRVD